MFIVRESRRDDLESILEVAKHLDSYNLPYDRDAISEILTTSQRAFSAKAPLEERAFTFVLEDSETKNVIGTSMLYAQHGTHASPHVYLDVLQDEHYSETLCKYMVHQALIIGYNYNGPTEIGGLILSPAYRGHKESLGKLLSFTRFLYIAMNRDVFRDEILSELLPRLEDDGTSRLWKHLGKRFTGLSYREADRLSKDNKEFIKSLFPHGMIYTSLFPPEVQQEIGEVGPQTKGVEKMLKAIGFQYANQIDPFDGGPHFIGKTDEITLIEQAQQYSVKKQDSTHPDSRRMLLASQSDSFGFRCIWSQGRIVDESILLPEKSIQSLQISGNDDIWAIAV